MRRITAFIAAICFSLSVVTPVFADSFSAAQKADLEKLIHTYLLEHPEILRDMSNKLDANDKLAETQKRSGALKSEAANIFHSQDDAVVGNQKGDVTLVEFFDYNCHFCKQSIAEVQSLIKTDKNVRIVMKEFPIFGEDSEYAARAALASNRQGKYWAFHQALFASPVRVTAEVVDQIAAEQGLDVAKMKSDMKDPAIMATIQKTQALAQALAITGTPGFLIDDKLIPGAVPMAQLEARLADVRGNGGCKVC